MEKMQNKKCVLVDGSSYLFRAYHALPPLITSKGVPTGAAYGMLNMLRKLLQDEKPDYFSVVFDTKSKNFRHTLYPEYKANRSEMAEELRVQIEPLHAAIKAMGIFLIALEGYEADDVIGSIAHSAIQQGMKILISTGDKDFAQLVSKDITLVNTMTGSILDEEKVLLKFGVSPSQIIDYLTLVGDPVDNVPGVPKVGPKTAAKWLQEYKTLDNIISNAHQFKGKVGEYLRESIDHLVLAKKLVTIQRDIPVPLLENLVIGARDEVQLKKLFEQLEFKSWLKELEATPIVSSSQERIQDIILEEKQLEKWQDLIVKEKKVAIKLHIISDENFQLKCVGIAFAVAPLHAAYIPIAHMGAQQQLPLLRVLTFLKPILEDPKIIKIGLDIKKDLHFFSDFQINVRNMEEITLVSYVLNSVATRHEKESLAAHHIEYKMMTIDEIAGKGIKQISFDKIALLQAANYAAEEVEVILKLHQVLLEKLSEQPVLERLYREIELPLVEVLLQIEKNGVAIDVDKLHKQNEEITLKLKSLEEEAYLLAGENFNLGSPKQLQTIFYEKLQLPILEKTPKGAPSTAENVLQELSQNFELPKVILQHRTLSKLKSTYIDKLPIQVNPRTHRIHTSYNQAITATGRLSSTDPNLQNIPIRHEEGRKIRQAFVSEPGFLILAADYSQIELRIMAHLSQDLGLLHAFSLGEDIHRFTASEVLGISLHEVSLEQRRRAKAINFGLIYGMSAFGLAKQLGIEKNAAQDYIARYFERYPGVKRYMDETREKAAQQGFVETLFGRRLYLPDIRSTNMIKKRAAERTAINAPMQGTAADIIKKAMIAIYHQCHSKDSIKMIMQVHDELVFEVQLEEIEKAKILITTCMQQAVVLAVPLVVEVGIGKNWDEAH